MKAFIFDLNGTMINDMRFHQKAWYKVVHDEMGSAITMDGVKAQMYGKNEELLWRVFPDKTFTPDELQEISARKEIYYQQDYKPHLTLLPGLADFLERSKTAGIKMAIGSAAVPGNIDFVLDNLSARHYFETIVSASDVAESKPNPETFLKAAQRLQADPADCVVFEDAPKGVECALNAGMKSIVLTTMHSREEFSAYPNILMFVDNYKNVRLNELF